MATFNISTTLSVTELSGKAGNDIYNINGGVLNYDCDSRYGKNQTTSTCLQNMTISNTVGGVVNFDGTKVRQVPYSSGSGNVPAAGTIISQGSVSGELICVMSTRTGTSVTAAGAAMPSTGYIKLRYVTGGSFAAGALTGIGASASGPDETSFIEIVGNETYTLTVPRLGTWNITGAWFEAGTTSGSRHQTIQLPAMMANTWYAGAWVETASASNTFEFWPNTTSTFWAASGIATDIRGKMTNITTNGLMYIGGDGVNEIGYLPPAGCKVRVPNIMLSNTNSTVGFPANAAPSTTFSTRYDMSFSNAGQAYHNIVNSQWYYIMNGAFNVGLSSVATLSRFDLQLINKDFTMYDCHIGHCNSADTAVNFQIQQCFGGGTITNCSALKNGYSGTANNFVNLDGVKITNFKGHFVNGPRSADSSIAYVNTCNNMTLSAVTLIGAKLDVNATSNSYIYNTTYCDSTIGQTLSTSAQSSIALRGSCINCVVDGLSLMPGLTSQVHPYTAFVNINTGTDIVFRNIGTSTNPLSCGTVNPVGELVVDNGNSINIKFQRIYASGSPRTRVFTGNKATNGALYENVSVTDASKVFGTTSRNSIYRCVRGNSGATVPYLLPGTFGAHFWDGFTGDTTSRAVTIMTEKTDLAMSQASYTVDAGNPIFLSDGTLSMPNLGDQVTWYWQWDILGWHSLSSSFVAGTNASTNIAYQYAVDTGAGYGAYKTLSNANLQSESVAPSGFKLSTRATCTSANTGNVLRYIVVNGVTSLSAQNAATRPLDAIEAELAITGLKNNTEVRVYRTSDDFPLAGVENSGTAFAYSYIWDGTDTDVYIVIFALGYQPIRFENQILGRYGLTIPVQQVIDRVYTNPT